MGAFDEDLEEDHGDGADEDRVQEPWLAELIERCEAAKLRVHEGGFRKIVYFPRGGRGHQAVPLREQDARVLLAVPFEHLRFVGRYDAIVSYEEKWIEAIVRPTHPTMGSGYLTRVFPDATDADGRLRILLADETLAPGIEVELSALSDTLHALTPRRRPLSGDRRFRMLSLKIRGLGVERHSAALTSLETIADALFFDLERTRALQYELALTRDFRPGPPRRDLADRRGPLRLPRNRYDPEPTALYRYARSAVGMPLLRFLAYYQVIEFYMPRFAQSEARSQLENVVKDPAFDAHDGRQIGRLLEVARRHVNSSGTRDERSQLRLTLRQCVDEAELAAYFDGDDDTRAFFANARSPLTPCSVSTRHSSDVRDQVADRVYDLRCKIVHTKDAQTGGAVELLLPNSPEAEQLDADIELLRFLASKVLVAASRPLTYHFS